ncbi:MAG: DUF3179 domain-containing protein [Acidimicrobiia bacterium]
MKLRYGIVLIALVASACSGGAVSESTEAAEPDPATTTTSEALEEPTATLPPVELPADGFPEGDSALDDMTADSFPPPLIDVEEIISGGPPPDGIPPVDEPVFTDVASADEYLSDEEPVVVLDIDGDARAYPIQIMIWHEIVNDVVGDVPVSVTYCPLCNSAVSYVRTIGGHETTFGTSGRLFASALVMYDRATETLWTHFDGKAVVGVLTGHRLEPVASPLLSWADFKEAYPDGKVLDRDETGFGRPYGNNPYQGYDNPSSFPFLFTGDVDDRSRAMQRVVGVRDGDDARAWTLDVISGETAAVTNTEVGDTELAIFWSAGQSSALESLQTASGRDVGSVGVFSPVIDGRTLTFTAADGAYLDEQTGSTWNITGRAVDGELAGSQLERIPHLDTFWFAWSTYAPGTDLIEE